MRDEKPIICWKEYEKQPGDFASIPCFTYDEPGVKNPKEDIGSFYYDYHKYESRGSVFYAEFQNICKGVFENSTQVKVNLDGLAKDTNNFLERLKKCGYGYDEKFLVQVEFRLDEEAKEDEIYKTFIKNLWEQSSLKDYVDFQEQCPGKGGRGAKVMLGIEGTRAAGLFVRFQPITVDQEHTLEEGYVKASSLGNNSNRIMLQFRHGDFKTLAAFLDAYILFSWFKAHFGTWWNDKIDEKGDFDSLNDAMSFLAYGIVDSDEKIALIDLDKERWIIENEYQLPVYEIQAFTSKWEVVRNIPLKVSRIGINEFTIANPLETNKYFVYQNKKIIRGTERLKITGEDNHYAKDIDIYISSHSSCKVPVKEEISFHVRFKPHDGGVYKPESDPYNWCIKSNGKSLAKGCCDKSEKQEDIKCNPDEIGKLQLVVETKKSKLNKSFQCYVYHRANAVQICLKANKRSYRPNIEFGNAEAEMDVTCFANTAILLEADVVYDDGMAHFSDVYNKERRIYRENEQDNVELDTLKNGGVLINCRRTGNTTVVIKAAEKQVEQFKINFKIVPDRMKAIMTVMISALLIQAVLQFAFDGVNFLLFFIYSIIFIAFSFVFVKRQQLFGREWQTKFVCAATVLSFIALIVQVFEEIF